MNFPHLLMMSVSIRLINLQPLIHVDLRKKGLTLSEPEKKDLTFSEPKIGQPLSGPKQNLALPELSTTEVPPPLTLKRGRNLLGLAFVRDQVLVDPRC